MLKRKAKWYALFDGLDFIEFKQSACTPYDSYEGPFETLAEARNAAIDRCRMYKDTLTTARIEINEVYRAERKKLLPATHP